MKRMLLIVLAVLVVLAVGLYLAFRFSPLPSVYVIRYVFSQGDQTAMAALEPYVPSNIAERLDLAYGDRPDETFDIFYPEGTDTPLPTIVWVHGGGWIGGSKTGVANYLRIVAGHGYTVVGLDYTTAPQALYPTPVRQVNAALGYLVANADALNIDADTIILGGDSAGSQIAAQFANVVTSPAYAEEVGIAPSLAAEQLAGIALFCGAYQLDGISLDGEFGWFIQTVLWAYTGVKDFMNDPEFEQASVTHYVTADFPPAFISGGNGDPLTPQSHHLADSLAAQGVAVETLFFPDDLEPPLPHEYQFDLDRPEGMEALERLLAFLEKTAGAQADQEP